MTPLRLITGGHRGDHGFNDPLLDHLTSSIASCERGSRIDLCISFIRQSGLLLLRDALKQAIGRGAQLRVITSDYLDVTQPVALRELLKFDPDHCQNLIYQSQGSRGFHLKSYLFIRQATSTSLLGQAFIGSSNISKAALTESLEWNWSLTVNDTACQQACQSLTELANQVGKLAADPRVVPLTHAWIDDYVQRYQHSTLAELRAITGDETSDGETLREAPMPNSVQQEALAALHDSRLSGHKRGLVVMATGLGKTWLAAFDVRQVQAARLLFIAHREEILAQARATFTRMAPLAQTGLYTGAQQDDGDWLFASIQTLGRAEHLRRFAPDHFDYIVVDEFHHAASPSYRRLLDHFQPRFLLGLTATPDRTDQADIMTLCDNNLVFERGLAEAIEQRMLVPLIYHGIYDDTVDYAALPWRNGQFDPKALETAFASHQRAHHALTQWQRLRQKCTLAFCISTRHADFMAEYFSKEGIRAVAVYAGSQQKRDVALSALAKGKIDIIFSVDLFNEGTDLPAIDTVLMLRPTESRIIFLQQLGRGLRRFTSKQQLVVIDLVGNHQACLYKPYLLQQQLSTQPHAHGGSSTLAAGCYINLDPRLLPLLERLRRGQRLLVVDEYRQLKEQLGYRPTALQAFEARIDFAKLRKQHGSWFELVAKEQDLAPDVLTVLNQCQAFLLSGIETTSLSKSFKIILLQALLELDGLRHPPTLARLAQHSRYVLDRYPELAKLDLPAKQYVLTAEDPAWLRYWRDNPIIFSTVGNKNSQTKYWFEVKDDRFTPRFTLPASDIEALHQLMQELVDLRLAEYYQSKLKGNRH